MLLVVGVASEEEENEEDGCSSSVLIPVARFALREGLTTHFPPMISAGCAVGLLGAFSRCHGVGSVLLYT